MKLRHLIWAGAAAYAGWQLISKRHELARDFRDGKAALNKVHQSWITVQHNLDRVVQQIPVLEETAADLGYKVQVFQKETEARLAQLPHRQSKTDRTSLGQKSLRLK